MNTADKGFVADSLRFTVEGMNVVIAPEWSLFEVLPVDFEWFDVLFEYGVLPNFVNLNNKTFPY